MRLACSHPSVPPLALMARKTLMERLVCVHVSGWGKTLVSGPAMTQQPWFCQVTCQLLIGSPGRGG